MPRSKLIAVTKVTDSGSSLRVTIPKEVSDRLVLSGNDHLGFYEVNGTILIGNISDEVEKLETKTD